jgi:hypothetical protein
MSGEPLARILETIREAQNAYSKLTLIVGTMGSGKTAMLQRIATEFGYPKINLSLHLSRRLLDLNRRQRTLQVEQLATEIITEHLGSGVCVDNTELLFDSSLRLNPMRLLQELSRNRVIIATWNGRYESGRLTYANTGHPDEFSQHPRGYPIVTIKDSGAELHLTA